MLPLTLLAIFVALSGCAQKYVTDAVNKTKTTEARQATDRWDNKEKK